MSNPPNTRPVFARHAASLLVWRDRPGGTEVLMGVRGAGARFVPNRLVFPGGAVDPEDAAAAAMTEPHANVLDQLGRKTRPRLARAIVLAAARELEEETGLSLGTPPRLDAIDYLCRAVTPPRLPIRFNARFLVVEAAQVQGALRSSDELHDVQFMPVEAALALDVMLVTREVLLRLQDWLRAPEAERRARTETPVFRNRNWQRETRLR